MSDLIAACRAEIERRRDLLNDARSPLPWMFYIDGGFAGSLRSPTATIESTRHVSSSIARSNGELAAVAVNAMPAVLDWCEQTIEAHSIWRTMDGNFCGDCSDAEIPEDWPCEPIRSVCAVLGVPTGEVAQGKNLDCTSPGKCGEDARSCNLCADPVGEPVHAEDGDDRMASDRFLDDYVAIGLCGRIFTSARIGPGERVCGVRAGHSADFGCGVAAPPLVDGGEQ